MCVIHAIEKAFKIKEERNWDKLYYAVDLHGTVLVPNYKAGDIPKEAYPYAIEVLRLLTERKDATLILYTCSYPHEIEEYLEYFENSGVKFDYTNSNPEVQTKDGGWGYFEDKFYFNVLFEDKASFNPDKDWGVIYYYLKGYYGK
jgi:hypothetical protein